MSRDDIPGIAWPAERILPTFQPPQHLTLFDLRGASPEIQLSATTMGGLINRQPSKVYFIIHDDDLFWHKELLTSIPWEMSPSTGDHVLTGMLEAFRNSIKGLIVYDPRLPDSINIATTLAGQLDGIVVSSTQAQSLQSQYQLPVLEDLSKYQWHSRTQAYAWARDHLLEGASAHLLAGLDPRNTAGVRSFIVAARGFVYFLDGRLEQLDSAAGDLSERGLMNELFAAYAPGSLHLGWFIDEGSGVALASLHGLSVLASDLSFNLEVWTSVQPPTLQIASPAAPVVDAPATDKPVYISFTLSDGDNLQYCQHRLLSLWQDPARGTVPIGWTFSPSLLEAAPSIAAYYARTATDNDELIAAPSGAMYMYPSHWSPEQLTPFLQRTGRLMQQLQMISLVTLDADFIPTPGKVSLGNVRQPGLIVTDSSLLQAFTQALAPFGVQYILNGAGLSTLNWYVSDEGLVVYQNIGLADTVARAVALARNAVAANQQWPLFLNIYLIAWSITPSNLVEVLKELGPGFTPVKPSTLLAMLAGQQ